MSMNATMLNTTQDISVKLLTKYILIGLIIVMMLLGKGCLKVWRVA